MPFIIQRCVALTRYTKNTSVALVTLRFTPGHIGSPCNATLRSGIFRSGMSIVKYQVKVYNEDETAEANYQVAMPAGLSSGRLRKFVTRDLHG